jgi:hypothetical protein
MRRKRSPTGVFCGPGSLDHLLGMTLTFWTSQMVPEQTAFCFREAVPLTLLSIGKVIISLSEVICFLSNLTDFQLTVCSGIDQPCAWLTGKITYVSFQMNVRKLKMRIASHLIDI